MPRVTMASMTRLHKQTTAKLLAKGFPQLT